MGGFCCGEWVVTVVVTVLVCVVVTAVVSGVVTVEVSGVVTVVVNRVVTTVVSGMHCLTFPCSFPLCVHTGTFLSGSFSGPDSVQFALFFSYNCVAV